MPAFHWSRNKTDVEYLLYFHYSLRDQYGETLFDTTK